MTSTLHSRLIPALSRGLATLATYLDRIEQQAEKGNELAGNRYLWDRLAPDMQPFRAQIQMAADTAKGAVARLAAIMPPRYPDTENTVAELRERVKMTDAFIRAVDASAFDGADERMIDQSFRRAPYAMRGEDYVGAFVLPNFYFHIATAHAILRAGGLDVGKADYLGRLSGKTLPQHEVVQPVRLLTPQEAASWIAAHALQDPSKSTGTASRKLSFRTELEDLEPSEIVTAVLGDTDEFRGESMVHVSDWIWDNEYEGDPTAPLREKFGEARSLEEVPAWVFSGGHIDDIRALLDIVIERNWTADLYLPAEGLTVRLLPERNGEIHASRADAEELIRYRLIELGVECYAA
jgi:hypothetical protein